jgi:DNA-directed RNA polymerase specialized sigma24 family protein
MHIGPEEMEQLERRVAQRDRAAFSTLHRAYADLIQHFVFTKLGNQSLARDMTVRIFDQAWERIDRYPWRDFSFHVWLLRIAREHVDAHGGRLGHDF